jgi:hypothetical protein
MFAVVNPFIMRSSATRAVNDNKVSDDTSRQQIA